MLKILKLQIQFIIIIFTCTAPTINIIAAEKFINLSKPLICKITPEVITNSYYPNKLHTSNNLRREQGGGFIAKGTPIIIAGFIMDENCIPLTNANITIWHTNTHGVYQLESNINDIKNHNNKIDPNFTGTGQTYTDNLGMYHFLTILPGSYEENPPYINILIQHNDFPDFDTTMLFPEQNKNEKFIKEHEIPNKLSELIIAHSIKNSINNEKIYIFNITLPGKNNYKRY